MRLRIILLCAFFCAMQQAMGQETGQPRKKVGLVLGGGGAKGVAHIGSAGTGRTACGYSGRHKYGQHHWRHLCQWSQRGGDGFYRETAELAVCAVRP